MQHKFDELLPTDTSPLDASDARISVLIVLFRKLRDNEVLSGQQRGGAANSGTGTRV